MFDRRRREHELKMVEIERAEVSRREEEIRCQCHETFYGRKLRLGRIAPDRKTIGSLFRDPQARKVLSLAPVSCITWSFLR
jgi:hypothetical protein